MHVFRAAVQSPAGLRSCAVVATTEAAVRRDGQAGSGKLGAVDVAPAPTTEEDGDGLTERGNTSPVHRVLFGSVRRDTGPIQDTW